jgi:hypothetical protein
VVRYESNNGHQKYTYLKEIGLRVQNMLTILGWFNNQRKLGGPMWRLNEHKNFHIDNEEEIHMSLENHEANGYGQELDSLIV